MGICLQHKLWKICMCILQSILKVLIFRLNIHLLLHFGIFLTLQVYFLVIKVSYLQKIQWKNRMKYDIKVTINAFRHIFIFTSNNKYRCSPYTNIFRFFWISCPYNAINKSIFVFLTTLCKLYFFSPWKWHLKRKPNIYVNGYSRSGEDICTGIKILRR